MDEAPVWSSRTVGWLAGVFACAAGLAWAIGILNAAGRAVMELGGFAAAGGPYEVAHPAPSWVAVVPLTVFALLGFGALSFYFTSRCGGFHLAFFAWAGLFVSLGYQFAVGGLNPPGDSGTAWGWILCAVVFVPMGLAPFWLAWRDNPALLRAARRGPSGAARPYEDSRYRAAYTACAVSGAAAGIAFAVWVFATITG